MCVCCDHFATNRNKSPKTSCFICTSSSSSSKVSLDLSSLLLHNSSNPSTSPGICSCLLISSYLSLFHLSPYRSFSISPHCCYAFSSARPAPWSTVSVVRRCWVCEQNTLSSPLHTGLRDETNTTTDRWGSSERFTVCMCEWNRSFLSGHKSNLLKAAVLLC